MSISPRHRAISPPTPAPSPQPDLHTSIRLANNAAAAAAAAAGSATSSAAGVIAPHPLVVDPHDPSQLLKHLSLVLPQYSQSARFRLISELTELFSLRELAHLSSVIHPRLKVDFLSALPIEVSLNILSFIDDPKTLARASCVSRFWRSLVNDEHTWKVMCLKHKYRRRGSSNAAAAATAATSHSLDDRLIRSVAATPSHLALSTPRLPPSASLGALLEQPHRPNPSSDMADDEADELTHHHDDDAAVLASLYQRYRDRGLDPSNALHELRTLHDLFLSKQDSAHGSLDDSMSEADLAFYAQLEEIVEEESRARYGDDAVPADHHHRILESRAAPAIGPTAALPNAFDILSTPIAETSAPSTSAHLGWLSARPPTATAAPSQPLRALAPTQPSPSLLATTSHAVSSSIRTASGQLDRLQGWQQPNPALFTTPNHARDADAPTSSSLSQSGPADNDSDEAMDMDDQHSLGSSAHHDDAAAAAANVGQPPNAPLLASLPHHDSPTGRFSASASSPRPGPTVSSLVPGPRDARRSNLLRPGASAPTDAASSPSTHRLRNLRSVSDARSSRRGSEPTEEETTGLGLGALSSSSSRSPVRERSAVAGPSRSSLASTSAVHAHRHRSAKVPFSYRTHFKMAYLTESNWRKGGRLQTQHVSADAGHVVTSLAIDSEWIVVGMANSKIHVFSAETGLYAHTLLGHDAGVWCLTLISRTGKGSKRAATDVSLSSDHGKGKMVVTDPEDGSGGKPYQAAADGDLRLVHHDPRPDAADALLSPPASSIELPDEPDVFGSRRPPSSTASTPASGKARQTYGHGETLEWFHKARRALRRQQSARRAAALTAAGGAGDSPAASSARQNLQLDGYTSGAGDSDADISIRSEGPAFVRRELRSSARARVERENAKAVAEAEAGAIRDAVMADGTGNIPAELAEEIRRNGESVAGPDSAGQAGEPIKAAGGVHSTSTSTAQLAGNALGMGNPCGSVLGYGNQDAIVVSGGCDRDVRVWDLRTGECKHVLRGHTSTVRCLKVLDGKPIAVSGSRDSTLRVWNVETGTLVHLLAGHQHSVRCIEVAGNQVASGSYDGTCRIWNLDTGVCQHVLRGHIHYIYAVAFDGKRVATGSLDSTVRVWSASTGDCLALFQGHTSLVGQLQLLDNTLVTGGSDGRVIVFSLNTYECLHRLCAHDNSVTCLQFDERYIITGGNDGRVKLWDFSTGKFIREICEPCEQVWKVSYRDDKVVVLCKRGDKTCMDVITFRPAADEM